MSAETPERIIDIGDSQKLGMYRSFNDEIPISIGRFFEASGGSYRFRFCRRNTVPSDILKPFVDVNLTGASVNIGIGERNQAPVSGTWSLSYNGDTTGLTALAFDITAAALSTALNANPAVTFDGGVVVSKYGLNSWIVTFVTVGTKHDFVANVESLQPEMRTGVVGHPVIGDGDTKDVQTLILKAAPYAATGPGGWTRYVDSGITITETQAGTTTKKAVRKLAFNSPPYKGSFTLNFPRPEVVTITTRANTAGVLAGTYFVLQFRGGTLGVWFSVSSSTIPAGAVLTNRQVQVNTASGDSAATVASLVNAALNTDASYTSTVSSNVVTATDAVGGDRPDPDAVTSGFALAVIQEGQALTSTIVYNGSAADLQAGLNDFWKVTQSGIDYLLECSVVGVQPAFTVEEDELIYPNGVDGALNLNTTRFAEAFAETSDESLSLVFEIVLQLDGELPQTVYQEEVTVFRTVLDLGAGTPALLANTFVLFTQSLGIGDELVSAPFPAILGSPCAKVLVTLNPPSDGSGTDGTHGLFLVAGYAQPGANDRCFIQCGGGGPTEAGYSVTILASI